MSEVVSRLFRHPESAHKALTELKAKGFKTNEIGLLLHPGADADKLAALIDAPHKVAVNLDLNGGAIAAGELAGVVQKSGCSAPEAKAALTAALQTTEEAYDYFAFGVSLGGVLVSVHAKDKLAQAQQILKSAEAAPAETHASPGFALAGRMTATHPIDAPMSGDFRKY